MFKKGKHVVTQSKAALLPQVVAAVTAAMVQLGLGAVVAFAGVTIPRLTDPLSEDLTLNNEQVALYASLVSLGAMAGCFLSSVAQVKIGQRKTMLIFLPAELLSWLLVIFTPSVELLLVARFLLGFFVGAMGAAAYTYVVEVSYKDHRGALVSIVDLIRQCGMLFVYILGSLTLTWRMMAVICACSCTIIPFIVLIFLPDSPRFLAFKKENDMASKALQTLRGINFDIEPELNDIIEQLDRAGSQGTVLDQFYQLIKVENLKIFALLAFLNFSSRFTGNAVLIGYTVPIFQATNSSIDSYTSTIIIGVVRVIGASTYLFVIDRYGRKIVFTVSLIFMAASGAVLGIYFYLQSQDVDLTSIGWLPLTCLVIFSFFTCIGYPVIIIWRGELLPTSVRSLGYNLITSILFLGSFTVSQTYPPLVSTLGLHGTFWLYSCCSLLLPIVVALFIPETKDKSLEEIQNKD